MKPADISLGLRTVPCAEPSCVWSVPVSADDKRERVDCGEHWTGRHALGCGIESKGHCQCHRSS